MSGTCASLSAARENRSIGVCTRPGQPWYWSRAKAGRTSSPKLRVDRSASRQNKVVPSPVCDLAQPDRVDHSQPLTPSFLRGALHQATFVPVGRVQQCAVVAVVVEMGVEHGDHVGVEDDDVGFLVEL